MKTKSRIYSLIVGLLSIAFVGQAMAANVGAEIDPKAKLVKTKDDAFKPDPDYKDHKYDAQANLNVYGKKHDSGEPFYPFFFGRRLYPSGQFNEGLNLIGRKNALYPHLMGFGDWRFAYAITDDGTTETAQFVTRMNLDLDLKLTSTERFHVFVRPFDKDGQFTGFNSTNTGADAFAADFEDHLDFNLDAAFFEGDLGAIWSGLSDEWATWDQPFAIGLMPILFQNGIWFNDILTGIAFTRPAFHSNALAISNADITFFAFNDEADSPITGDGDNVKNDVSIYGFNAFIEAWTGYMELGYAYTEDELLADNDQSYHNIGLSWTARFRNHLSYSFRTVQNFGQEADNNGNKSAEGQLYLFESSLMTSNPYFLVPYINLFFGNDKPQAVASQNGLLNNTGLVFEADGMTSFPTLDNNGQDTWGGAIGIEYLFNLLGPQIVFEVATVQPHGPDANINDDQYGFGIRYQHPIGKQTIFRADGIYAIQTDDAAEDFYGLRTELRFKF